MTMAEETLSNSEELENEQTDETQNESPDSEPATDQHSELFDDIDLNDENLDGLTLEELRNTRDRMNQAYTQKTQGIAQVKRDAELWNTVAAHPEIAESLNNMIIKVRRGESLTPPPAEEQLPNPADFNPQEDMDGYMGAVVVNAVTPLIKPLLQEIADMKQQMAGVGAFVQTNQSNLEFENLRSKYPASDVVGVDAIKQVQVQYPGMNMEKALGVLAIDHPELLQKTSKNSTRKKATPKVENAKSSSNASVSNIDTELASSVRALQQRSKDAVKDGTLGIRQSLSRVFSRAPGERSE